MNELSLQFDAPKMNTKLAEEYLKENNCTFYTYESYNEPNKYVLDNYNNKIYYNDSFISGKQYPLEEANDVPDKLKLLAKSIIKNSELFAQLESLIRNKPEEEVQRTDMKLIVHNILYCCTTDHLDSHRVSSCEIVVEDRTPLLALGFVAQVLLHYTCVVIMATPNTAAVCHLFTKLCHNVGLSAVVLQILKSSSDIASHINEDTIDLLTFPELQSEGVGVITGKSDVDSAVDILLSTSTSYPMRIRRVLVQENIYESIKNIFQWKCRDATGSADQQLSTLSASTFVYGNKTYLFDFAGTSERVARNDGIVLLEAYRTTKELISLMGQYNPFFMSLWSSDAAETDEIAFSIKTPYIWVNDYGVFDGSSKISQALFGVPVTVYNTYVSNDSVKELLKRRSVWMKLDADKRIDIIKSVLVTFSSEDNTYRSNFIPEVSKHFDVSLKSRHDGFFDIANGKVCIGVKTNLIDVVLVDSVLPLNSNSHYVVKLLKSLIDGYAILFDYESDDILFRSLSEKAVPVMFLDKRSEGDFKIAYEFPLYRTKIVFKNFGTIFAN